MRVIVTLSFDEKTLRELLESPYGKLTGQAILDAISEGMRIDVICADGTTVPLTDPIPAEDVLRSYGWLGDLTSSGPSGLWLDPSPPSSPPAS